MPSTRVITFHIADPNGRPSIKTTRPEIAKFMEDQGWTVTDIVVSGD